MARGRSFKDGLDYFSMDVHLDDKFQLVEAEYGLKGFAVVVKLFQRIYGGLGYYCEWNEEVSLLFRSKIGLGGNDVSEIVAAAIRRGLFDKRLLDTYGILTSSGIQKRYFEAVERRKCVQAIKEYLLLDISILPSNVCIKSINVDIKSENACDNSQSKLKETKGKETTTSSGGRPDFNTIEAYASGNLQYLSPTNMDELISFMEQLPEELIRHAIDEACACGSRKYYTVRNILNRYVSAGFKCLGDALAEEEAFRKRKQADSTPQKPEREMRWRD